MPDLSYETIKPLAVRVEVVGSIVHCTFECPITGDRYDAGVSVEKSERTADGMDPSASQPSVWRLGSVVRRTILRAIGYDPQDLARTDVTGSTTDSSFAQADSLTEEVQEAIVRAFKQVMKAFAWDDRNRRWVSERVMGQMVSDFSKQLVSAPVTEQYDRSILARMLIECAHVDQRLTHQEMEFIDDFIAPELAEMERAATRPALTPVELAKTSAEPTRETMLMLAWALTLADENLGAAEEARLIVLGKGLGISNERIDELKRFAQVYLVDQAIGRAHVSGGFDDRDWEDVVRLAQRVGLEVSDAEQAMAQYRKRHGLE